MGDGFDAAEIVFESDVLVGSVRVFIGETETEEHARNFEGVVHLRDERDGAAFPNEDSLFSEALFECALRDFENGRVERRDPRFAGAQHVEFALDGLG